MALLAGSVTLSWQPSGTNLVLSWPFGTLLQAANLDGPWTPVPGAAPPAFTVLPLTQMFYRVRVYP